MQCTVCGREITNPEANYCDYCGTALGNVAYREEQGQSQPQTESEKKDKVPMTSFLGVMCLSFIPMVGSIAYLVFLFYWAFASNIQDSRKSYARAALIYTAITIGVVIIMCVTIFSAVMSSITGLL